VGWGGVGSKGKIQVREAVDRRSEHGRGPGRSAQCAGGGGGACGWLLARAIVSWEQGLLEGLRGGGSTRWLLVHHGPRCCSCISSPPAATRLSRTACTAADCRRPGATAREGIRSEA
jgi:hypothetical protein